MSLRGLSSGFRDKKQRDRVQAAIQYRFADDREQQECRYLMRFWWQLSMSYSEVSLEELRTHVGERKFAAVEALIAAIRTSHDRIDAWAEIVEVEFPVIHDRGYRAETEFTVE